MKKSSVAVYSITNIQNNKIYIGSSVNVKNSWWLYMEIFKMRLTKMEADAEE